MRKKTLSRTLSDAVKEYESKVAEQKQLLNLELSQIDGLDVSLSEKANAIDKVVDTRRLEITAAHQRAMREIYIAIGEATTEFSRRLNADLEL